MKNILTYLLILFFGASLHCQTNTFIKRFYNYDAVSINHINGKNYIYYTLAPVNKSYVAELTDDGDTLNTKVFDIFNKCNTPYYREGYFENEVLVYTTTYSGSNYGILFTKQDANLNYSIFKKYTITGNVFSLAPNELSDSSFLFIGSIGVPNYYDMALMKADKNGNPLWTKIYDIGGRNDMFQTDVIINHDKTMFLSGNSSNNTVSEADYVVMKADSMGNPLWANRYGGTGFDTGGKLYKINNHFYVVGFTKSFGFTAGAIYLMKIDTLGNLINAIAISTPTGISAFAQEYNNGMFTMTGIANYSTGGSWDCTLMQMDTNGIVLNNKVHSLYSGSDNPINYVRTANGGYIINATVDSGIPIPKLFKTDSLFNACVPSYSLVYTITDVTALTTVTPLSPTVSDIMASITVGADTILPATNTYSVITDCVTYVSIDEAQETENILAVYPNPAQNEVNITYDLPANKDAILNIYDFTGKLTLTQLLPASSNTYTLNTSSLSNGVYLCTLTLHSTISSKKLIIAK